MPFEIKNTKDFLILSFFFVWFCFVFKHEAASIAQHLSVQ